MNAFTENIAVAFAVLGEKIKVQDADLERASRVIQQQDKEIKEKDARIERYERKEREKTEKEGK